MNLVFIIGSPRSGTTLLQSLLATQPRVMTVPETFYFDYFGKKVLLPFRKADIHGYMNYLSEKLGSDFSSEVSSVISRRDIKNLSHATFFLEIFHTFYYIKNNRTLSPSVNNIYIEKTPSHFLQINNIRSLFPSTKFICIIRHPIPTVLSSVKYWKKKDYYSNIAAYARMWQQGYSLFDNFKQKNTNDCYSIKYEDLISNSTSHVKQICDFVGIEFDDKNLKTYREKVEGITTNKEHWKNGNRMKISSKERNLSFRETFSLSTIIIQYYTRKLQIKLGFKVYHPFLKVIIPDMLIKLIIFIRNYLKY